MEAKGRDSHNLEEDKRDVEGNENNVQIHEQAPNISTHLDRYDESPSYRAEQIPTSLPYSVTHSELYRQFHELSEKNKSWLDVKNQKINLDPDDMPLLPYWTPVKVKLQNTLLFKLKRVSMLFVYFGIYALIAYNFLDHRQRPYNQTFQAFFFPVLPYVLLSYRGFSRYIKSLLLSLFLIYFVYIPAINKGIIDIRGVIFVKYFVNLQKLFPNIFQKLVEGMGGADDPGTVIITITLLLFLVEFILMILYWIFHKVPRVEIVISRKAIFIRAKTKRSIWDILKEVFWIILNPFNVNQYKEVIERIRYNRLSAKEGKYYDFSKISMDAIKEIKKRKNKIVLTSIVAGILTFFLLIVAGPLAIIPFVWFIKVIRQRKTYRVIIEVHRNKVEGSWILSHSSDILDFYSMPEDVARFIAPIKK